MILTLKKASQGVTKSKNRPVKVAFWLFLLQLYEVPMTQHPRVMDSRHPYGGLSTGTLQYLCLKTDDVFKRLQESVEKAVEPRGEVLLNGSRLNL